MAVGAARKPRPENPPAADFVAADRVPGRRCALLPLRRLTAARRRGFSRLQPAQDRRDARPRPGEPCRARVRGEAGGPPARTARAAGTGRAVGRSGDVTASGVAGADRLINDAPTHHFTKLGDRLARRLQIEPTPTYGSVPSRALGSQRGFITSGPASAGSLLSRAAGCLTLGRSA